MDIDVIVGIDEVGRGPWAGPLLAAAVILKEPIEDLKDSKLLTREQRNILYELIKKSALSIGVGWASVDLINKVGLTKAITFAMRSALTQINKPYGQIIIDGNYNFLEGTKNVVTQIKADKDVLSVSAASIIAKVERDNFMIKLSNKYPNYGFDKHVGYGTKLHAERLSIYGPCPAHRINYKPIKALVS